MNDTELDAMVNDLRTKCPYPAAGNSIVIRLLGNAADAITALRAQLAEVLTERDAAQAALAAQIEADPR